MRDKIDLFLETVDEQIACKLCHEKINDELRGHIEDKAEDYRSYGLSEEEALGRAIRDMGEPDVIGMELNRQHQVRTPWPVLGIIGLLLVIGLAELVMFEGGWSSLSDLAYSLSDGNYYIWGLGLLLLVIYQGYPFLLKHAGMVVKIIGIFCGVLVVGGFGQRLLASCGSENMTLYRLYSSGFQVLILGLGVPVSAVWLYRRRAGGCRAIALLTLAQAFYLAALRLSRGFRPGGSWIPVLCLLLTCLGIELYMAVKGWFGGSAGKAIAAAIFGFAVLLTLWAAPGSQARELWNRCIHPEAYAANSTAWDDSYNNMLIRELLSRAENFGEVQLSREELLNYGTGEWYYGKNGAGHWKDQRIGDTSGEDSPFSSFAAYREYRLQFLEHPTLEKILPDKYQSNYRAAWWVLHYGRIPAAALMLLSVSLPAALLFLTFRIRNRLGRTIALSGGLLLTLETVIYLVENLGYQFSHFSNLPFLAEGWSSITITALAAGMVLSVWRYDRVVTEKERKGTEAAETAIA